jgi:LAO/AO transport system kinase
MKTPSLQESVQRMRSGDRGVLARLLTRVERGGDAAAPVLEAIHPYTGHAYVVGITGPPGAGKSTLADALTSMND